MNQNFKLDYASRVNTETWEEEPISWKDNDMAWVFTPHHDPVVMTIDIRGNVVLG